MEQWRRLRAIPWPQLKSLILLASAVISLSVLWGMATAIFEDNAPILLASILASILILTDYRIGVILLILFMPVSASTIFPHQMLGLKGLNPLNMLILMTLSAYGLRLVFAKTAYRLFPKTLLWFYIFPILLAGLHGSVHVGEIPAFLLADASFDDTTGYLRDIVIKPLLLVIFSVFVGAAIYDGLSPRHIMLTIFISIWIMSLMVIIFFLLSGTHYGELASPHARGFLSSLGLHPNDLGRLYATAYAMLLFSLRGVPNGLTRLLIFVSIGLVCAALVLTFSRAAFAAFIVINVIYFAMLRSFKTLVIGILIAIIFAVALPGAVYQRASLGFGAETNASDVTAGRSDLIWEPLLPEIRKSPLIGGGLGYTMWSDAMQARTILPVGHPHNAFLKVQLDMGVVGFILLAIFYWRGWKDFRRLAGDQNLDPWLRRFFEGASVGLVAYLLVGMSGSSLDPAPEQSFIWLALGMAFGVLAKAHRTQLKASVCAV